MLMYLQILFDVMAFRTPERLVVSAAYSHRSYLQLRGMGMAFLTLLLLYCLYWHSSGLPLSKSTHTLLPGGMLLQFMACMHASIMGFPKLWLLHALCNSIPRTRDGRVAQDRQKGDKIRCIVP